MSVNQLIETSRRALQAMSGAMNTVGLNVANANTEGYSRRRVTMNADSVVSHGIFITNRPQSATGTGVRITSYDRQRDDLLAGSVHEAQTGLGAAQEEQRLLSALEGLFPVGNGSINSQLDAFWNAWQDVADYPADNGVRHSLRSAASVLIGTLNRADEGIQNLKVESERLLTSSVEQVNDILKEIALINKEAEASRMNGSPDLVAEDRRDQLVKDLSAFVPVRAQREPQGYRITLEGMTVVQEDYAVTLDIDSSGPIPQVFFHDTQVTLDTNTGNGGKIGAILRSLHEVLPDTRAALDTLAETLVTEVNSRHTTGYGLDGGTGRDFFDPVALKAGSIRLSADVLADSRVIAASADPTAQGDSTIALDIAGLRSGLIFNSNSETPEAYTSNMLADIGANVQRARTEAVRQSAVIDHVTSLERAVSGVSLDEEMALLIRYQQGFSASARVLDTAQQMMDTLLAL